MSEKKNWMIFGGVCFALAAGAGALIYLKMEEIKKDEAEIVTLDSEIASAVSLLSGTKSLEEEVILQRETDEVVATILPNDQDIAELVSALQQFESQSGVSITDLKPVDSNQSDKSDFEKVIYSLQLSGDAFEILAFVDLIESHDRFMSVPRIRLTTTRRPMTDLDGEIPRHEVRLDVETYVYEPKGGSQSVDIENYEGKRDRLEAEILSRRDQLAFTSYDYMGRRGRRDPWVDPRVPINLDPGMPVWPIEQQIAYVEEMIAEVEAAEDLLEEMLATESYVESAKLGRDLQDTLAFIQEEIRRTEQDNVLLYVNAAQRFESRVVQASEQLHDFVLTLDDVRGPSAEELGAQVESMERHLLLGEYLLAMELFHEIED